MSDPPLSYSITYYSDATDRCLLEAFSAALSMIVVDPMMSLRLVVLQHMSCVCLTTPFSSLHDDVRYTTTSDGRIGDRAYGVVNFLYVASTTDCRGQALKDPSRARRHGRTPGESYKLFSRMNPRFPKYKKESLSCRFECGFHHKLSDFSLVLDSRHVLGCIHSYHLLCL